MRWGIAASALVLAAAWIGTPASRAEDPTGDPTDHSPADLLPADPVGPGALSETEQAVLNQQKLMEEMDGIAYGSSEASPTWHVDLPSSVYAEDPDLAAQGVLAGDIVVPQEEIKARRQSIQAEIQSLQERIKDFTALRDLNYKRISARITLATIFERGIGSRESVVDKDIRVAALRRDVANIEVTQRVIDKDIAIANLSIQHLTLQSQAIGKSRAEQVAIGKATRVIEKAIVLVRIEKSRLDLDKMDNEIAYCKALIGAWQRHGNHARATDEERALSAVNVADNEAAIKQIELQKKERKAEIDKEAELAELFKP